ncbi:putative tail spike [Acinetobacter phage vB_AbaP_APK128]|uniref:Putative tail spike n=1 Tax=Acinetobacter phage vB_AbaP_APK128 TaxID=2806605 RepID=A0A8E5K6K8_9CAUD|nr:putative tail spike [Acinetobacter phage vB_AbaP_APK128]
MNILRSFTETVVTTPTDTFPISFEYDEKYDAVHVFLNDVAVEDLGYTVSQVNAVTLKVEPAIPEGTVRIERETDIDKMKYIFDAGALFIDQNVDADFRQIVHSQQEVRDGFIKLRGDVLPLVHGLQEALQQAQEASEAAQEAANAAEVAAAQTQTTNKTSTFNPDVVYPKNARIMLDNGNIVRSTVANNTVNPNSDMTGWFDEGTNVVFVESIADMLAINNPHNGQVVYVKGYYAATNFALAKPYSGGGHRIYIASRKTENDGFLCINGWVLQVENNTVTPEHAGAIGNNKDFDQSIPLNKVVNSGFDVSLSATTYYVSKPVRKWKRGGKITGTGELTTKIVKTTNNIEGFGTTTINGKVMNFDVDAVLILMPDTTELDWYVQQTHISGFSLAYDDSLKNRGYGLYTPLICRSSIKHISISNCKNGVYSVDSWMVTWERVEASADKPFIFGAPETNWLPNNTSQTFISCWAKNAKGSDSYAWYLLNMQYSTFISCGNDFNGTDGSPINSLIYMRYSDVSFIDMGFEFAHAYNLLYCEDSVANFVAPNIVGFENRYQREVAWNTYNAMFNCVSNSTVKISGGRINTMYTSTNSTTVAAFSMCQGNSKLIVDLPIRFEGSNRLEEIAKTTSSTALLPAFGMYCDSTSKVDGYINNDHIVLAPTNDRFLTTSQIRSTPINPQDVNLNDIFGFAGNYAQPSGALAQASRNYPEPFVATDILSMSNTQIAGVSYDGGGGNLYFRVKNWSFGINAWRQILSSGNTTVDANGFIKAASPIVKLFADKIELNDEAADQNIIFEKLGVGDYLIKNSHGFSNDGWYIEAPKDANGNNLFALVYKTLENGDISVKTYAKKFDIETASIIADISKPVDINEGRWIDVRLN